MKKTAAIILTVLLAFSFASCGKKAESNKNEQNIEGVKINLSDGGITVDGAKLSENEQDAVYAAKDIVYYEEGQDFTYGEGDENDAHSKAEADEHTVVHITKAGTYVLSGTLSKGQIAVDLGEGAEENPDSKVTLVLNNANITCTVAPSIIFYRVYECGSSDTETANKTVDTKNAGANVTIADGSENTLNGSYVAKIYKSVVLSEDGKEITDSKKLHKYDGALYSKMSMNIDGKDGVLNVNAENEGVDSELHLTINGGNINIVSGDDGINTNEDGVSVTTVNGGNLNIKVRDGAAEGDGIDSNGWIVINGGNIVSQACSKSGDAGVDSDNGIYLNGGTLVATGNMLDAISGGAQNYAVFTFKESQNSSKTYELLNSSGTSVIKFTSENAFTNLIFSSPELKGGEYTLTADGKELTVSESFGAGQGRFPNQMPNEDGEPPQKPDGTGKDKPEHPEMPSGVKPDGEMPSGEMKPNENGEINSSTEQNASGSTVFTLNAGGNTYSVF